MRRHPDYPMVAAVVAGRHHRAELGRGGAAATDGDGADAHGDVVGELAAVLDVPVGGGVEDVADRQLPAGVAARAHGARRDLDPQPEPRLRLDVAAHPGEGAVRDGLQVLARAVDVELEVGRVEVHHVDPHRVGDGDEVALLGDGVDADADLVVL